MKIKKQLMMFLVMALTCVSAVCFASHGTDLDAEERYVDQFMAGKDYAKVSAFMDPQLAKNVTREQYTNLFTKMNQDLGKLVKKELWAYELFDDGHVLHYVIGFEKAPVMVLDVVFKKTGDKVSMLNFRILDAANNKKQESKEKK